MWKKVSNGLNSETIEIYFESQELTIKISHPRDKEFEPIYIYLDKREIDTLIKELQAIRENEVI